MVNINLTGNKIKQALFFSDKTETPERSTTTGEEMRRNTLTRITNFFLINLAKGSNKSNFRQKLSKIRNILILEAL